VNTGFKMISSVQFQKAKKEVRCGPSGR
jgi:hypothetical protein